MVQAKIRCGFRCHVYLRDIHSKNNYWITCTRLAGHTGIHRAPFMGGLFAEVWESSKPEAILIRA